MVTFEDWIKPGLQVDFIKIKLAKMCLAKIEKDTNKLQITVEEIDELHHLGIN